MKIIPITEPREGFVYENGSGGFCVRLSKGGLQDYSLEGERIDPIGGYDTAKRIGALNITHRIEDGKLIEIPRGDIEVGDVFEDKYLGTVYVGQMFKPDELVGRDEPTYDLYPKKDPFSHRGLEIYDLAKKIGIMGVTHEISWEMNDVVSFYKEI